MTEQRTDRERLRTAELVASLSLATDLAIGVPIEHGLQSTVIAMRLAEMIGLDPVSTSQTFYGCLLFYVGCTATADLAADLFGDEDALTTYVTPFRFGSRAEMVAGMLRAVAPPSTPPLRRAARVARGIPKLAATLPQVVGVNCDVARLISGRFGLPTEVGDLFGQMAERWDGHGQPAGVSRDRLLLPIRIIHVARDAAFQAMLHGPQEAARVIGQRGGRAFDPQLSRLIAANSDLLVFEPGLPSLWEPTMGMEPSPHLLLDDAAIEQALGAMGDFSDLVSPYLVGHSVGVAELARAAAGLAGLDPVEALRAATIHDLGRVTVPVRVWRTSSSLTTDDWERVRLHSYFTERILSASPFLRQLARLATTHHERLDGSGYHAGLPAAALTPSARLLAAADVYHAMLEPRPHRPALTADQAAKTMESEVQAGRLDGQAVAATLEAAGHRVSRREGPAGLTLREMEVVVLLARGHQTKQSLADSPYPPRPPTVTSKAPTARSASPPELAPLSSPCSVVCCHGENSQYRLRGVLRRFSLALARRHSMSERRSARMGAIGAPLGGVLLLVGNIIHPRERGQLESAEALLEVVAGSGAWAAIHTVIMIGVALLLVGYAGITNRLGPELAWAWLGWGVAIVGTGLAALFMLTEAVALPPVAEAWATSSGEARSLALSAALPLFHLSHTLAAGAALFLFGFTPLVVGWAVLSSGLYPSWIGRAGIVIGVVGVGANLYQILGGVTTQTSLVLVPAAIAGATLWMIALGIVTWRSSPEPAPLVATPISLFFT